MKQLIIFALVCLPLLCACGGSQQKEADATYKTPVSYTHLTLPTNSLV